MRSQVPYDTPLSSSMLTDENVFGHPVKNQHPQLHLECYEETGETFRKFKFLRTRSTSAGITGRTFGT